MAGTWLGVAYGFGGMRLVDGGARFAPVLPQRWQHYSFRVLLQGARLQVRVGGGRAEYTLLDGAELHIHHRDWALHLDRATPSVTVDL
jgi:alpha,alpha-trehalose phosphorylase